MRIIFITKNFPPETGGIQTYSTEISSRLAKKCDFLQVVAPFKNDHFKIDESFPAKVFRIKVSNHNLFLPLIWKLPWLIKKSKAKIIFHAQRETLLPSIFAKGLGLNVKIVCAAHARELLFRTFTRGILGKLESLYTNWTLKKVDLFLPVSDYTKKLLLEAGVSSEKIKVVINGTNPKLFFPKRSSDLKEKLNLSEKKIILTVSRLYQRKGIDLVIKSLIQVIREVSDCHYLIIGEGPEENKLKKLVRRNELTNHVTFAGHIDEDLLNEYYNICDVFVMPSITSIPSIEGFGIVFLEANACKKPVIGSDSGGIPSAIIDCKTGLIVHENDIEELALALVKLLKDESYAKKLGENGYQRVISTANWANISNLIFEHLKRLEKVN